MGRPWGRRALTRAQEQERGAQTRGHQRAPPPQAPPHACPARAAVRGVRPGPHPKPASRPAPPLDPPTDESSDQDPKPAPGQLAPGPPADPPTDESSDRTRNPTPNPPQGRPGTGPRSWIRTRGRFGTLPTARTTALGAGAGARALLARGGVGGTRRRLLGTRQVGEADRWASLPGLHPVQRGSRAVVQGAKGGDWVEGALSPARLCPLPLVWGRHPPPEAEKPCHIGG